MVGAIAVALGGISVGRAATGAPTAPPDDTFEITITSGTVVAPGGSISFEGTCWSSILGAPTQYARVRGVRHVPTGSGLEPFAFAVNVSVNGSTGAITGSITVPGDAPNGAYELRVICVTQDQYLGGGQHPFTIDGPLITTTTTTTTSVPLRAAPRPRPPAPAPARPLSTTAELTG